RPHWRVIAFHRGEDSQGLTHVDGYIPRRIEMPGDRFDAWLRLRLPWAAKRLRADVLHCPANACPTWNPVPTVVTIHDLIPIEEENTAQAHRLRASIRHAVTNGLTIITPSSFTAQQLVHHFGAIRERLVVNPWAAD